MKNFLNYACVFAAVLSMASCQKNEVLTEDDYVTATFTIEAPAELSTKAIGDGTTAKNLVFAVYPYDSRLTDDQNDLAEELTFVRVTGQRTVWVTSSLSHLRLVLTDVLLLL